MKKYLIRLDDACSRMNHIKWEQIEKMLDKYGVKPLVGVIPHNEDLTTYIDDENPAFWTLVKTWESKGWIIALHGYNHVCTTTNGGINPVHMRSEFAGLSLIEQMEKISQGYSIFKEKGIDVEWFFAPSHTFDENTLEAIKRCTPIKYISDTIARKPYKSQDLIYIPCQMGTLREIPISGYWCGCYHPNLMEDKDFLLLENFLALHKDDFISFSELPKPENKDFIDRLLGYAYFKLRKLKG